MHSILRGCGSATGLDVTKVKGIKQPTVPTRKVWYGDQAGNLQAAAKRDGDALPNRESPVKLPSKADSARAQPASQSRSSHLPTVYEVSTQPPLRDPPLCKDRAVQWRRRSVHGRPILRRGAMQMHPRHEYPFHALSSEAGGNMPVQPDCRLALAATQTVFREG